MYAEMEWRSRSLKADRELKVAFYGGTYDN